MKTFIVIGILLSGLAQAYSAGADIVGKLPSVICQPRSFQEDCNTCSYQLCTDGKVQWETATFCTMMSCTAMTPYNPKDWNQLKN